MTHVTAVFSDLHANGRALRAAVADARTRGFDRVIVLGDLLTYGLDQDEVLDTVATLQDTHGATVVTGNHDQLYLDLADGRRAYYDTLPQWLRETADHTLARLDAQAFRRRFAWQWSTTEGPWFLSHANPFGDGDWRYLYNVRDALDAARALAARSSIGGIFGHTHRRFSLAFARDELSRADEIALDAPRDVDLSLGAEETSERVFVVNPGSVGQPRHTDRASTYLRMTRDRGRVTIEHIAIDYDAAAHVRALRESSMSESTREKLCSFFEGARY